MPKHAGYYRFYVLCYFIMMEFFHREGDEGLFILPSSLLWYVMFGQILVSYEKYY
ncbi:MAG: hypothetical protein LBJ00_05980 [Planctomycetaceae bacterium]|nr:hypothetical protein [Planctomycetaceae bacterium]